MIRTIDAVRMLNPFAAEFSFGRAPQVDTGVERLQDHDENDISMHDESLAMLYRIFPDLDQRDLYTLYCVRDHDLLKTVEELIYAEPAAEEDEEKEVNPSRIVCKYFLMGQCLVKNCEYLHSKTDRSAICKFWLKGYCMRGDGCVFLHSLDEVTPVVTSEQSRSQTREIQRPKPAIMYKDPVPVDSSRRLVVSEEELDLASKMKLDLLKSEFSRAPPKAVFRAFAESSCNAEEARRRLRERFGSSASSQAEPKSPVPRGRLSSLPQGTKKTLPKVVVSEDANLPWLETGQEVNRLYKSSREEAEMHCRARNTLLMRATQAYLAGDGKLAKELSSKGREHAEIAERLHAQAAENIFESRNRRLRSLVNGTQVIDLHGLHPEEALVRLEEEIRACRRQGLRGLCVVTGTGRHVVGGGSSRLRIEVRTYLVNSGVSFEEMREGGTFKIDF